MGFFIISFVNKPFWERKQMTRAWLFKAGLRYNPASVSAKLNSDMKN